MSVSQTPKHSYHGLADVSVGSTAICTVGKQGLGLSYRGYAIEALAAQASFEEVAYLLLHGELPTSRQLNGFITTLISLRSIPSVLKTSLETIPADAHPMDVLRSACSLLGSLEPELDFSQQLKVSYRLLAILPAVLIYWYRFHCDGKRIETELDVTTTGEYFLTLLNGEKADPVLVDSMNISLILYAEHEFNASTFAARVTASTLSDFYSAVVSAIGTLRGPLHGGANEAAMKLLQSFDSVESVETLLQQALDNKQKIMGFGHRVYKDCDPRSAIIKKISKKLSERCKDKNIFAISEAIERNMWQQKKLFPNLDFYSASAYYFMQIPTELYTPIFVCSRITGWAAHIMEQRQDNALIRPAAEYHGPNLRAFVDIQQR